MIALVDYGVGNITAFADIFKRLNVPVVIADEAKKMDGADHIILPGVGAFDWAMQKLNDSGMRQRLDELVLGAKIPVLGVCVGMQMMANGSDEGDLAGLGWIDARVRRFAPEADGKVRLLPHMGWNDVEPTSADGLFSGLEQGQFYFLHSYYFEPASQDSVLAVTDYGERYASAVGSDNVYGTQFHPEKSHHWGVELLRNFAKL
ncbi:MAG: imidazole glycerol phosphate synthase subunit HisH [Blastomonas sp.]